MSRIVSKPETKYPWYVHLLFWLQRRNYGRVLEPSKLWGLSPRVFLGVALLYGALNRKASPIDPQLRALITVRVSQINWCRFCVDINSATVLKRGGTEDKLNDLEHFRDSPHFTEVEKAVLDYAEAMTITDREVTDEMVNGLKAYYDDAAISELTGLIAFQNLSSKYNSALDVQPQGFCKIPSMELKKGE